jgi:hypothetical protein
MVVGSIITERGMIDIDRAKFAALDAPALQSSDQARTAIDGSDKINRTRPGKFPASDKHQLGDDARRRCTKRRPMLERACMAAIDPKQAAAANRERFRNMLAPSHHPDEPTTPGYSEIASGELSGWVDRLLEKL